MLKGIGRWNNTFYRKQNTLSLNPYHQICLTRSVEFFLFFSNWKRDKFPVMFPLCNLLKNLVCIIFASFFPFLYAALIKSSEAHYGIVINLSVRLSICPSQEKLITRKLLKILRWNFENRSNHINILGDTIFRDIILESL